jgi:hypothetical protein
MVSAIAVRELPRSVLEIMIARIGKHNNCFLILPDEK